MDRSFIGVLTGGVVSILIYSVVQTPSSGAKPKPTEIFVSPRQMVLVHIESTGMTYEAFQFDRSLVLIPGSGMQTTKPKKEIEK